MAFKVSRDVRGSRMRGVFVFLLFHPFEIDTIYFLLLQSGSMLLLQLLEFRNGQSYSSESSSYFCLYAIEHAVVW